MAQTFRARRYVACLGKEMTVHMTLLGNECGGEKQAVKIRIGKWSPRSPMCLGFNRDLRSSKDRKVAADHAVDFFEHHHCGRGGLDGARKRRR